MKRSLGIEGGRVPRLSVIVPTYNRRQLLLRLLLALRRQDLRTDEFEVIVVDDGSTDDTWTALQTLDMPRPGWLRCFRQANLGPAAARNRALQEAQAEWIAMTDDDTLPEPDWLTTILKGFQENPGWVGLEGTTICPDPDPLGHWVENLRGGQFITANMAYRADVLRQVGGFDTGFPFPKCEDTELAWRCQKVGPVNFYPAMKVIHPNRPQSWTAALCSARYELSEFRLYGKLGPDYHRYRRFGHPIPMLLLIYGVVPWFRAFRFRRQLLARPHRALAFALLHVLRPFSFIYYGLTSWNR